MEKSFVYSRTGLSLYLNPINSGISNLKPFFAKIDTTFNHSSIDLSCRIISFFAIFYLIFVGCATNIAAIISAIITISYLVRIYIDYLYRILNIFSVIIIISSSHSHSSVFSLYVKNNIKLSTCQISPA